MRKPAHDLRRDVSTRAQEFAIVLVAIVLVAIVLSVFARGCPHLCVPRLRRLLAPTSYARSALTR
jgi:hypothetical protein